MVKFLKETEYSERQIHEVFIGIYFTKRSFDILPVQNSYSPYLSDLLLSLWKQSDSLNFLRKEEKI